MKLRLLDIEAAGDADEAALAAWVTSRCGHVTVDDRLTSLGYRFYAFPDSELPPFFCRRFAAGARSGSISLLAGVDAKTGEGSLDDCTTAEDAQRALANGRAGLWLLRCTYGPRTLDLAEIAGPLAARDPMAFRAFAAELRGLGAPDADGCQLCRLSARHAA